MSASRKASKAQKSRKLPYPKSSRSQVDSVIVICKTGDVILVCGEEKKKLRVSSQMLRASCEVFDRMFSPDFSEGQSLSSAQPKEIPLPHDGAESMEILCNIIHLHNDNLPEKLTSSKLLTICRLIDKYSLHRTTHLGMERWLSTAAPAAAVVVSQLLNNKKQFRKATKTFIFDGLDDFQNIATEYPDENLFPVLSQMERARNAYMRAIRETISAHSDEYAHGDEEEPCRICFYQDDMGRACQRLELLHQIRGVKLSDMVKRVNEIPATTDDSSYTRQSCPDHSHLTGPVNLRLLEEINNHWYPAEYCKLDSEGHGLCLSCTRAGKSTVHTESEPCPVETAEDS